jgi:very-short-patch-repair endonuclease
VLAHTERVHVRIREELLKIISRYPKRSGTALLRALLAEEKPLAWTRSEAEKRFLKLIEEARLPRPQGNVRVEGHQVDFVWRAQRIVVEVDGFAFHSSRPRFENDRRRDGILTAAGFRVIRVTWRQMEHEPIATLVRVGQALARSPT